MTSGAMRGDSEPEFWDYCYANELRIEANKDIINITQYLITTQHNNLCIIITQYWGQYKESGRVGKIINDLLYAGPGA